MKREKSGKMLLLAALWLSAGVCRPQMIEPPLPGTEGPARPDEAFTPLLEPGDLLPPESEMPEADERPLEDPPLRPAGTADLPDIPANLPDLDFDNIPGLVRPKGDADLPPLPGGLVQENPLPEDGSKPGRAVWLRNPREARKLATAEGKPLLLFFASSWKSDQNPALVPTWSTTGGSPTQLLRDDLTGLPEFNAFASEKLVTCLLYFKTGTEATNTANRPIQEALTKFKTHFKIHGLPCILLLDDKGRELERISGYARVTENGKIYSAGHVLLDRLITATDRYGERKRYQKNRREELAAKGFREWTSRAKSTLFAKVVRATPKEVIMVDETRKYWRVPAPSLSIIDLEWIRRKQAGTFPHAPPLPASAAPAPEQSRPAAVVSAPPPPGVPAPAAPASASPLAAPKAGGLSGALGAPPPDSRRHRP